MGVDTYCSYPGLWDGVRGGKQSDPVDVQRHGAPGAAAQRRLVQGRQQGAL